jgi:hypothetical protein
MTMAPRATAANKRTTPRKAAAPRAVPQTAMAATLDLDAARQARLEAKGQGPIVTFGERDYQLVVELPLDVGDLLTSGKMRAALELMLEDPDDIASFMANRPTLQDLDALSALYGMDLGE